ncbi:MAG: DUF2254 domain-containing protein [Candidatus Aminicenantes bacterium]|nr:DUF2254 domain-containing protein [Candidatus Aminicenantes bacterium]
MKIRLMSMWEAVRTSFWFVPSIMVIAASGLAFGLIQLDRTLLIEPGRLLFSGGIEGARTLLSTIAGSMITIAGVTFSITIVALTLTSSQFGSRLLRNFMADRGNQLVLGTFIATFLYCLLVMNAIPLSGTTHPVPAIAVTFSFVLALIDLGVLIFFYHHVSNSIHADSVINSVARELDETIARFIKTAQNHPAGKDTDPEFDAITKADPGYVNARSSGYLRALSEESLMETATREDIVIQVHYRPGEYIFPESVLATIYPATEDDTVKEAIANAFIPGTRRTPEQDLEFAVHQLVEVALRALSPGINDPFTAISCINRLGTAVCRLSRSDFPSARRFDKEGKLRLVLKTYTYGGLLDAAFYQIRQSARGSVAVYARLLETLAVVAAVQQSPERALDISRHAKMIRDAAGRQIADANDLTDIEKRYLAVMKNIALCRMGPVPKHAR